MLFSFNITDGKMIACLGRSDSKFDDELADFSYSPDGQSLAVTRGGWQHDIVLIRDLYLN